MSTRRSSSTRKPSRGRRRFIATSRPSTASRSCMSSCCSVTPRFFLHDEFPDHGQLSPLGGQATGVVLHLYVEDVDTLYQQAVEAGVAVLHALAGLLLGRSATPSARRSFRPSLVDGDATRRPFAQADKGAGQQSSMLSIATGLMRAPSIEPKTQRFFTSFSINQRKDPIDEFARGFLR